MIVISCDTIQIAVQYGVLSVLLGCQSLQLSLHSTLGSKMAERLFSLCFPSDGFEA